MGYFIASNKVIITIIASVEQHIMLRWIFTMIYLKLGTSMVEAEVFCVSLDNLCVLKA